MEKKNPNIYQRALDIVNHRINPDIPQGGGGVYEPFIVHGTGSLDTGEFTLDKTYDEIIAVLHEGRIPVGILEFEGGFITLISTACFTAFHNGNVGIWWQSTVFDYLVLDPDDTAHIVTPNG